MMMRIDGDYDVSTLDDHHYEVILDIHINLDVDLDVEGMISWSWC